MTATDGQAKLTILIIGAGLGGLAAAYYFAHQGHHVKLYEKRDAFNPRGGTMSIRPNATRSLIRWGLRDAFESVADEVGAWSFRDLQSGQQVARHVNEDFSGFPDWGIDRKTMQEILYKNATAHGAEMSFGSEAVSIDEGHQHASVLFSDGSSSTGDMVLLADGIGSAFRSKILGDGGKARPIVTNATNFTLELEYQDIVGSGLQQELASSSDGVVWIGQDRYAIGRYASKLGKVFLVFDIRNGPASAEDLKLWQETGDLDYVRKSFEGCCDSLDSALRLAKRCDQWHLAYLPELPRWTSEHGRLLLLGDSAHAMLPNVAQGFSTIVEDIDALGACIAEGKGQSLGTLTEVWSRLHISRVNQIQAYAKAAFNGFSGGTAPGDGSSEAKGDGLPNYESPDFIRWVVDHDAYEEVHISSRRLQTVKFIN